MKWDRLVVFVIAAAFWGWANAAPNTFPQTEYGRGFPLKWTYDPLYKSSNTDNTPPYLRKYTPEAQWKFDRTGLAVDIALGLVVVAVALAVNELVQTSAGNRSPAIPPNV